MVQPNPSEQTSHKPIDNQPFFHPAWFDWHLPHVRESKTVLDSGFHTVDFGFQVLDSSICQWNLKSGFQSLVGFRILWAVFLIPKPRIPDSTAKIARIPECGFLYMGRDIREFTQRRRRRQRKRKKAIGLARFRQAKQQLCKCITPFVHLYVVVARLQRWNCLISRFVEDGNRRQQLSFPFPELWCSSLEFNSQKISNIWRIKRDGISAIKFEAAQIHLLSDVFVAVPVVVA